MSNDLNQCNFIGRLGKDPEVKYLPSGEPVTSFSIAVGSKFGDKEHTEWVNVTTFKKLAEICGEYLKKGAQVFITGRLQTDSWEKDGVKQYRTKVIADRMQMLGGKSEGKAEAPKKQAPAKSGSFDEMDDDIPF